MSKMHEPGNGLSIRIHGLSSDFSGRADFGRHWLTTFRRFGSTYPFRRFPADALAQLRRSWFGPAESLMPVTHRSPTPIRFAEQRKTDQERTA
ncbi:hypothetical protein FGO68_gene13307 [Halteria grandinella]|uniref:Uncharacterized protein n=1 Tax=Halteria grandinella TaxID=5974 RepID=A0A8J8NB68_HALGN|nr:hypothetical protein FGO68_gene13307 [Halteria grandinella]